MKPSIRDHIFQEITRVCQILISEVDVLCELIDDINDASSVVKKIGALEDEADTVKHEIGIVYQQEKLFEESEGVLILNILEAVENCTDLIDDISQSFIRLNITEVKDNIVSAFMSAGTGAVKMSETITAVRRMDKINNPMRDIIELDHYREEYQKLYDINMNKLYTKESDPIDVLRWTAIYNSFRELFEGYEDVAECCGRYCYILG